MQRCNDCGFVRWPPAIYHYAYHEAFKGRILYNAAVVKLDEGPMLLINIVDCNNKELSCDISITAVFKSITSDYVLPCFKIVKN
ncbi:MAG: hypothetical protein SVN78_10530 [Deferribacterota bacterium]|nr:hypothetical protein [Deferribacterota bacterium]